MHRTVDPVPDHLLKNGFFEAPEWLSTALENLPKRSLTPEEHAAFQRDGVVLLPGALDDPVVLTLMKEAWGSNQQKITEFRVNSVFKSLLRDGPFGALASSALNASSILAYS